MKVIINILVTVAFAWCEVPPPYPSRGFRPSPPFNLPIQASSRQVAEPHRTYGVPSLPPPTQPRPVSPQTVYGVPNRIRLAFNSKQTIPRTSYGVPITESNAPLRNNFKILHSQPQVTLGAPNRPQTQYGIPSTTNTETLEQIREVNFLLQLGEEARRNKFRANPSPFRNSNGNAVPSTQYLPQKEANNFRDSFDQTGNTNFNRLQSQCSIGGAIHNVNCVPSKEVANFQLPQNNAQNNFGSSNQNLQQLSQQFLPVKEAGDFKQGFAHPLTGIPQSTVNLPNSNFEGPNRPENNQQTNLLSSQIQPSTPNGANVNLVAPSNQYVPSDSSTLRPTNFNRGNNQNFNQQMPENINAILTQTQNVNPNNFQGNPQDNFDLQQADVRKLQPSKNGDNRIQRPLQNTSVAPTQLNTNCGRTSCDNKELNRESYLPPSSATTAKTINKPRETNRPNVALPTTEAPVQENEPSNSDEDVGGPNIAVATAVAGSPAEQSLYLLQPDGRLQRVIYQKTREEGDQENEYTANYLFQNIQHDPGLIYSPLITLGK